MYRPHNLYQADPDDPLPHQTPCEIEQDRKARRNGNIALFAAGFVAVALMEIYLLWR
ncbi:MAG TPA: hypothetical protein VF447_17560 [Terriglobales bacterium]